jgi:hypothetical protein
MNNSIKILEAEKANLKQVIHNLKTDVLAQVCTERDTAIAENVKIAALIDQLRGNMSEEARAEVYVKHIIPSAYGNDEYNGYGGPGTHQVAFIQYRKSDHEFPTIGYSWIEVAEKLATGWRP